MYKGIYVALSGAALRSNEMDSVANNIANVNTAGYKRTTFSSRLYPLLEGKTVNSKDFLYSDAKQMTDFGQYGIDKSPGNIKTTGNPLDLAVNGEGFFAVQAQNKTLYTRNGSFTIDKEGYIATNDGRRVLDTANQTIRVQGNTINVASDGSVYVDGNNAGKLKVAALNNILHVSDSLFSGNETGAANGEVMQGAIEMSNVNPIREMVGVINALRLYESAMGAIKNFDELAQKAVSEIARF
jgi:flagellar basal-body rod protein FlgG